MTDVVALLLAHPRDSLAIFATLAFFFSLNLIRVQIKTDLAEMKATQKELVKAVQDLRVEQVRLAQTPASHEEVSDIKATLHDMRLRVVRLEEVRLGL